MRKGMLLATVAGFAALVGTGAVNAADKLKIGVTATLEGTYTVLGEDGMRGYELAVDAHGGKVAGKEIETIVGSTDASPDSAVRAAKKLVEQDKVDVLISPLSGSEGIAIRDYSKTQPQITVICGWVFDQSLTAMPSEPDSGDMRTSTLSCSTSFLTARIAESGLASVAPTTVSMSLPPALPPCALTASS